MERAAERRFTVWERVKMDALAATDCWLLIDCSLLRRLMCCYCSGISGCFPRGDLGVQMLLNQCFGLLCRGAAAAGGGELHLFVIWRWIICSVLQSCGWCGPDRSPNWQQTNDGFITNLLKVADPFLMSCSCHGNYIQLNVMLTSTSKSWLHSGKLQIFLQHITPKYLTANKPAVNQTRSFKVFKCKCNRYIAVLSMHTVFCHLYTTKCAIIRPC